MNERNHKTQEFSKSGEKWEREDDQYLIEKYDELTDLELARKLQRTPKGVVARFYVLKNRGEIPNSAVIRSYVGMVETTRDISINPRKAIQSVPSTIVNKNELKSFVNAHNLRYYERWTPVDREILKRMKKAHISSSEIAKKLGRTTSSIGWKYNQMKKEELERDPVVLKQEVTTIVENREEFNMGLRARFFKLLKGGRKPVVTATGDVITVPSRAPPVFFSSRK
jgi:hypothetical protein